ncbi:MAG: hypothetical protein JSW68_02230 [Burkholderiales bacterium]|nr:MAG: hypothetical protein JSW68_02230 [Burkholderiales bacterium]
MPGCAMRCPGWAPIGEKDMADKDPRLSELWQAAEHPEPSPELDARILAAARRSVEVPRRRRPRWLSLGVPVSTVAVLVLAVTLAWRVEKEAPLPARQPPASAPTSGTEAEATERAARQDAPAREATPGTRPEPAQAGPARRAPAAVAPPAVVAPHAARPATPSGAPSAPAAKQAAPTAAPRTPSALTPEARDRADANAAAGAGADDDPEQAVAHIRALLASNRTHEARQLLRELRRRHPGYALPEDLRQLGAD